MKKKKTEFTSVRMILMRVDMFQESCYQVMHASRSKTELKNQPFLDIVAGNLWRP